MKSLPNNNIKVIVIVINYLNNYITTTKYICRKNHNDISKYSSKSKVQPLDLDEYFDALWNQQHFQKPPQGHSGVEEFLLELWQVEQ